MLPVKTRWGSHLYCIESLLQCKVILQNMALNSTGLNKYKALLLNEDMWNKFERMKFFLKPIVDWITKLEGDYCSIHLVHAAFLELEELLKKPLGSEILKEEFDALKEKFNTRKLNALKPIHYAAALLDPQNRGSTLTASESLIGWEFVI